MYDENLIELETLYRTAPVGLCLVDRDLRYVRVNERLAAINGKPPGEHIGRTIREIIPEIAPQIESIYRRVIESGESILDVETRGISAAEPEVERRWHCSYYPIKSPDGKVEGVSTVVEDITALKRAKEMLKERLRFETLLSDLSTTFINLPDSALGREIEQGLKRLTETLKIDRVAILEFSEDKTRLMIAHIYGLPGAPPFPGFVASGMFPWITEKIRRGEMLVLSRCPDDLPEEAKHERQYCLQRGLKSHLTLPLTVGGSILGAMAFGSYHRYVTWPEDLIQRLRIAGEVFANALVRKRAAKALRTGKEALLKAEQEKSYILDHLTQIIVFHDRERRILWANQAAAEAYGTTLEQLQGRNCYEALYHRSTPCEDCPLEKVLETGQMQELERTSPNGKVWIVRWNPVRDEKGEVIGFLDVATDITERKRIEEALRASEAKYRMLVEQIPAITYIAALNESSSTLFVSPQIEDILGHTQADCQNDPDIWIKWLHPEDRDRVLAEVAQSHKTGEPLVSEYRMLSKSGKVVWFRDEAKIVCSPEGQPLFLQGVMLDITERRMAETSLERLSTRNRLILESAWEGIFGLDLNGNHTFVNPAAARMLGYEVEELIGRHSHSTWHHSKPDGSPYPAEECHIYRVIREGSVQPTHITDEVFWRKDGTSFPVEYTCAPISSHGKIRGAVVTFWDITQRKRAEEALRASEEELRKSRESYRSLAGQLLTAQEAERTRLARELHDDVSQRLAALAIEASKLERQLQSSPGAVSAGLKEVTDKLVGLSMDIHAISRRLHPSILDDLGLADAIQSECASFAQREGIGVKCQSENLPPEIPSETATCIYRIVQEGLRNISKHASATEVEILLNGERDTIHLFIKDNGMGFNPLLVKKKGGLGLASMKERVYLMRGDLSIQSQPGEGTVIEALVPLSRSPLHETDANIAG